MTDSSVGEPGTEAIATAVSAAVDVANPAKAPTGPLASQGEVPGSPPDSAAIYAKDKADAAAGVTTLKTTWGADAGANFASLQDLFQSLDEDERAAVEFTEMPDGRLALNDPAIVQEVLKAARTAPPVLSALAKSKYDGDELAALQEMMADRSSPYWRGKHSKQLQFLYRDHLRRGSK